jgi:hypothetical protein
MYKLCECKNLTTPYYKFRPCFQLALLAVVHTIVVGSPHVSPSVARLPVRLPRERVYATGWISVLWGYFASTCPQDQASEQHAIRIFLGYELAGERAKSASRQVEVWQAERVGGVAGCLPGVGTACLCQRPNYKAE